MQETNCETVTELHNRLLESESRRLDAMDQDSQYRINKLLIDL